MSPFDKCIQTLRALATFGDVQGISVGEKAIDEFLAESKGGRLKALIELEQALIPNEKAPLGPRTDVAELLFAYVQSQKRALDETG